MPEIVRLTNCKICIYPGDNAPPHFHVRGPGWSASIMLGSLLLLKGRGPQADLNEALKWAMQPMNLYRLTMEWRLCNERD